MSEEKNKPQLPPIPMPPQPQLQALVPRQISDIEMAFKVQECQIGVDRVEPMVDVGQRVLEGSKDPEAMRIIANTLAHDTNRALEHCKIDFDPMSISNFSDINVGHQAYNTIAAGSKYLTEAATFADELGKLSSPPQPEGTAKPKAGKGEGR